MDKEGILSRKLWLFDFFLLALKPFNGCAPLSKVEFTKNALWVQLHNFPLVCMNEEIGK